MRTMLVVRGLAVWGRRWIEGSQGRLLGKVMGTAPQAVDYVYSTD